MPEEQVSYLSQVSFDQNLRNKWWAKYILNIRLVLLLILSIIILGGVSFITIPRRLNPEVKIPIVIVTSILPGAAPTDIESLVTIPIEDSLDNIANIDTMSSVSRENVSIVSLQFLSTVEGEKALQDVQTALSSITNLPEDAQSPTAKLIDFEDQPIWTFVITSTSDTASLMRFSRMLRDKIKNLQKVDRVETSGFDTQEIQVLIDRIKVAEYGISPLALSQLVKQATSSYPAGNIQTETSTFALSIDKDVISIDDIRNLRLTAGARSFRLSDIATVVERSKVNQPKTYVSFPGKNSTQAVQFFVYKSKSSNIDAAEKDVKEVVDKTIKQYKGNFTVTSIMNTAEEISEQFTDLYGEFRSTIFLVFILLLIFLGFKQAFIASLTVPLTFLSAFAILSWFGLSLNFLTLFAFLLTLGLLIDDTIVTVAAMTRYYRTGKFTPAETGMLVWRDFIVPLWSTTITTIWAFVPLILSTGIIGEFIKSIPIVVTATMLSSTSIAVLITLPLMIVVLKPSFPTRVKLLFIVLAIIILFATGFVIIPQSPILPVVFLFYLVFLFIIYQVRLRLITFWRIVQFKEQPKWFLERFNNGFINIEALSNRYKFVISRILISKISRRNTLIAIAIFALIGYSLVPLGFVKNEFFPKTDENILYAQVELPSGSNIAITNKEMITFFNRVKKIREINYIVGDSGVSIDAGFDRSDDPGSFLLTIHLIPADEREKTSQTIAEEIRASLKDYTKGRVSVFELSSGPPAGADIQISVLGDDLAVLDVYTGKVMDFLRKQENVTNVNSSNKSGTSKLVFVPNKTRLAEFGMTPNMLGLWLRTYASGFTLDTMKLQNEDTDITFRMSSSSQAPETITSIVIPSLNGQVQLSSLGVLQMKTNPTQILRENSKRRVTVTASTTQGSSATEKNNDLLKYTDSLDLPEGYSWSTGGVNEENTKSVQSILQAMVVSLLLILVTMVIEFGSFRQTFIALLIIPLAICGVFYIFALTGTPLSFPALIGILALFGIVVTHAIVVIEKINENRKHGMNLHDAIVDASGSRLEPVLLTSLATIVGLIPITVADPLWRGLGGAIIAGLLFSGAIKLFFVPILYYNWFNEEKKT